MRRRSKRAPLVAIGLRHAPIAERSAAHCVGVRLECGGPLANGRAYAAAVGTWNDRTDRGRRDVAPVKATRSRGSNRAGSVERAQQHAPRHAQQASGSTSCARQSPWSGRAAAAWCRMCRIAVACAEACASCTEPGPHLIAAGTPIPAAKNQTDQNAANDRNHADRRTREE